MPLCPPFEMRFSSVSLVWFLSSKRYLVGIVLGVFLASFVDHYPLHRCTVEESPSITNFLIGNTTSNKWTQPSYKEEYSEEKFLPVPSVSAAKKGKIMKRDRILCWVVTSPQNKFKAEIVRDTWGRRCDKLLFMSSKNDSSLPAIGLPLPGPESRDQLWNKAKLTFRYVYDNHLNDYDWFFKADDDTYAIMENMRNYLSPLNPSEALFLGRAFIAPIPGPDSLEILYLHGGSGYVFSRETLRRLMRGLDQNVCNSTLSGDNDDVILAECLLYLNVTFGDTRDIWGHQRFIPFSLEDLYDETKNDPALNDFIINDYYTFEKGYNCCSVQAISFHRVSGYKMQMYEYLLYKLKTNNGTKN